MGWEDYYIISSMEFLKKKTRSHKYLNKLTKDEIHKILEKYVIQINSITFLSTPLAPPEVYDEYTEHLDRIVECARVDLQKEFKSKIKIPHGSSNELAVQIYLNDCIPR